MIPLSKCDNYKRNSSILAEKTPSLLLKKFYFKENNFLFMQFLGKKKTFLKIYLR